MIGKATLELAHKNVNSIRSKLIESNQKIIIGSDGQWNTRRHGSFHCYNVFDIENEKVVYFKCLMKPTNNVPGMKGFYFLKTKLKIKKLFLKKKC